MKEKPVKVRPFLDLDPVLDYQTPPKPRWRQYWETVTDAIGWLNWQIYTLLGVGIALVAIGLLVFPDRRKVGVTAFIGLFLLMRGIRLWRDQPPRW